MSHLWRAPIQGGAGPLLAPSQGAANFFTKAQDKAGVVGPRSPPFLAPRLFDIPWVPLLTDMNRAAGIATARQKKVGIKNPRAPREHGISVQLRFIVTGGQAGV